MKTLHVIGFKNSGKTTLVAEWVHLLKSEGLSVAVLKHHGHEGPLAMPDSGTDTMQFLNRGADVSVVAGGGAVQLHMNYEPDFARMKEIATVDQPDVLLIEGYKKEQGDKVVLLRDEEDWTELQKLQGIKLVVGPGASRTAHVFIESRTEKMALDQWLLKWVKGLTPVNENIEKRVKL